MTTREDVDSALHALVDAGLVKLGEDGRYRATAYAKQTMPLHAAMEEMANNLPLTIELAPPDD